MQPRYKSGQSITVYQKTDMDENIAVGQAMGQDFTNNLGVNIPALPTSSQMASLPPQDTYKSSLVPFMQDNSSTIADLQDITCDIGDLFSDFESQTTVTAAFVQTRQILPAFHGCTIGTISININYNK